MSDLHRREEKRMKQEEQHGHRKDGEQEETCRFVTGLRLNGLAMTKRSAAKGQRGEDVK